MCWFCLAIFGDGCVDYFWRHVKRQGPVLTGFLLAATRVSGVGFGAASSVSPTSVACDARLSCLLKT